MCHPSLYEKEIIHAESRYSEYKYLKSSEFNQDMKDLNIELIKNIAP